jgi:hypothetical protein
MKGWMMIHAAGCDGRLYLVISALVCRWSVEGGERHGRLSPYFFWVDSVGKSTTVLAHSFVQSSCAFEI